MSAGIDRRDAFTKDLNAFLLGVRPRSLLSVPAEKGICFPHLFVPDSGQNKIKRVVAATYRLKDHPDITIMVQDASASVVPEGKDPKKYTELYQSNYFWTQNYRPAVKTLNSLLNGSHNKIKLAGQDAVETMFRLVRENDIEDFGYLVVSRGDPEATIDTPDLRVYVIRNADNAKKKGITPIPKNDFFAMAKSIAASVKHREIN
jgi:hypothetical protein